MAEISMDIARYDALVTAALDGDTQSVRALDMRIRSESGVRQYRVWVRWMEIGGAPAPRANPLNWPPTNTAEIVLDRAPEREDVESLLRNRSIHAAEVHVTRDPEGQVGWYTLDDFRFEP